MKTILLILCCLMHIFDFIVILYSNANKDGAAAPTPAVVTAKPEAPPPVHEDLYDTTVEPVTSWAEEATPAAPATTFGTAAPAQEDWAAQVQDEWGTAAATTGAPAPAAPAPTPSWGGSAQDWSAS